MGDTLIKRRAVLWVRNDFRLADNRALLACKEFDEVTPIFVWDESSTQKWQAGSASKWWLHHALIDFKNTLKELGSDLLIFNGPTKDTIIRVLSQTDSQHLIFNDSHNPIGYPVDHALVKSLEAQNIQVTKCHGSLLAPLDQLLKKDGTPYLVFTPFWKNFVKTYQTSQIPKIKSLPPLSKMRKKNDCKIESLNLLAKHPWHEKLHKHWVVGEKTAHQKLSRFLKKDLASYAKRRDIPGEKGTSFLSPHFHFGDIHPQRALYEIEKRFGKLGHIQDPNVLCFCKEILWREFSYHLLNHFPSSSDEPLRKEFKKFPWKRHTKHLELWKRGQTGYPIVDAAMRQLWDCGWMHNRLRMITASFLVKHLNIPWQDGAKWFWDTLVDADLANNTQGWQWTAGCGADASPFFRIFNPIKQGETFDPNGAFVSEWCPELAKLDPKWIHKPWEAPLLELKNAEIILGKTYPLPIVDHKEARNKALWHYERLK